MPLAPVLLMTRPAEASARFVDELRAMDAPAFVPIISPLLDIVFGPALPAMSRDAALAFTSVNGVRAYAELGGTGQRVAYCVGDATAAAARAVGLRALSAGRDVEALADLIAEQRDTGQIWHLRGTHSRGALAQRLRGAGLDARDAVVYDQPSLPLSPKAREALGTPCAILVPLFSPRTAIQFCAQNKGGSSVHVVALSLAVAEVVDASDLCGMHIAAAPNATEMRKLVVKVLKNLAQLEANKDAQ